MKIVLCSSTSYHLLIICKFRASASKKEEEEKNRKDNVFMLIMFVSCAVIRIKIWGYQRIMHTVHAWSLLNEFFWAKTEDLGEIVEGAYINYNYGTFQLNQCSWLKTLRRSSRGRAYITSTKLSGQIREEQRPRTDTDIVQQ